MPPSLPSPLAVALDYGGTLTLERSHTSGALVVRTLRGFGVYAPAGFAAAFEVAHRGDIAVALRQAAADTEVALPADVKRVAAAIQRDTPDHPVDPRAAAAVQALHARGVRLLLAANTSRSQADRCATLARAGIADCFSSLVLSSELHVAKPDKRFYRAVAAAAGCPPVRVLFVGDRLTNDVLAPRDYGMPAVLIDRHNHAAEAPAGVPVLGHLDRLPELLDKEKQR